MNLNGIELTPDDSDPFNGTAGAFGRRALATSFITILRRCVHPTTIILDAPWGEGKTTFLQHLKVSLDENHFPTIIFDSFKYFI